MEEDTKSEGMKDPKEWAGLIHRHVVGKTIAEVKFLSGGIALKFKDGGGAIFKFDGIKCDMSLGLPVSTTKEARVQ